eukprot:3606566-Pyramimonas_sp.AAC.1
MRIKDSVLQLQTFIRWPLRETCVRLGGWDGWAGLGGHRTSKQLTVVPATACQYGESYSSSPGPSAAHHPWLPPS